jgi:hypothetical protein
MARAPLTFKVRDVRAALKAALEAGRPSRLSPAAIRADLEEW